MAKKHNDGYLSAKESRRISKENRKITNELEKKRKRKNVPESEYLTEMHDPNNAVEFDNLHTYFFTDTGVVKSVDGVTFSVPIGKTVGVVGESGCGKSVTSLSLMQLLQRPQGQVVEGEIRLNLGDKAYDVTKTPDSVMQHLRGNFVSMIFQEPMTALNPVFRIGDQLDEVIALHGEKGQTEEQVREMADSGLVSIQSHGLTHADMDAMDEETLIRELGESQRILTRVTGRQPSVLCYPTGRYSDLTLEVAERYYNFGLKMVGGQYNTADDPFLVSRYYVSRYTGLDSFAAMVAPAGT